MTLSPKKVCLDTSVLDAVSAMEGSDITSVFVVDQKEQLQGLVRLHDLLGAKIL